MGERMKHYLIKTKELVEYLEKEVKKFDALEDSTEEKEKFQHTLKREKEKLLVQISFFQHERMIHLIVTALFALMTILVFILAVTDFAPWTGVLLLLLLLLLIPYIKHYYLLENGTQKLYQYYDKLEELCHGEKEISRIHI